MRATFGFIFLLVLAVFLLSNRDAATLGFWPFGYVLSLPMGAIILIVLAVGFLAGLVVHWPGRLAAQRRARRAEKRNAELEARLAAPPPLP